MATRRAKLDPKRIIVPLIVLAAGVVVWYENNGSGKFSRHLIGKNQGSYDIRAIDLDADKDLDLLIAGHTSRNIVWYENPKIRR